MASPKVKAVLEDTGQSTAKNELAFFFRLICRNLKINPNKWEYLLQEMLDKNPNLVGANPKDRSYARGNLNTQLSNDRLTWRTFMDALRFLKATEAVMILDLTFPDRKTRHSMRINLMNLTSDDSLFNPLEAEPDAGITTNLPPLIPPEKDATDADPTSGEPPSIDDQLRRSIRRLAKMRQRRDFDTSGDDVEEIDDE